MFIDIFKNVQKEIKDLSQEYDYDNLNEPEKEVMDKVLNEYKSIRNVKDTEYCVYGMSKHTAKEYAGEIAFCSVLEDYVDNQTPENRQKLDFLLNKFEVDIDLDVYNGHMVYSENSLEYAIKSKDNELIEEFIDRGATTNDGRYLKYLEENNIDFKSKKDNGMEL